MNGACAFFFDQFVNIARAVVCVLKYVVFFWDRNSYEVGGVVFYKKHCHQRVFFDRPWLKLYTKKLSDLSNTKIRTPCLNCTIYVYVGGKCEENAKNFLGFFQR